MPGILDRLASGGATSLVGGLADIAQGVQQRNREDKQTRQENSFKKQQLGITSRRIDLDELMNKQNQEQQQVDNELSQDRLLQQEEQEFQQQQQLAINQDVNNRAMTKSQTIEATRQANLKGQFFGKLLSQYPDDVSRLAAFDLISEAAQQRGVKLPRPEQGVPFEKFAKAQVLAADQVKSALSSSERVELLKQQEKQRVRDIDRRAATQKRARIKADNTLSPALRAQADTLDPDSLDTLIIKEKDPKNIAAKKEENAAFLQSINSSKEILVAIDGLVNHPGLDDFQGFGGSLLASLPLSTDAGSFKNAVDNFEAKKFIGSVGLLANLGALSDAEGKKIGNFIEAADQMVSPVNKVKSLKEAGRLIKEGIVVKWAGDNPGIGFKSISFLMNNPTDSVIKAFKEKNKGKLPRGFEIVRETILKGAKGTKATRQDVNQVKAKTHLSIQPGDKLTDSSTREEYTVDFDGKRVSMQQFARLKKQRDRAKIMESQPQSALQDPEIQRLIQQNRELSGTL
jgi:hypothetical protein